MKVRPFVEDDIEWVADLYAKVFLESSGGSSAELREYFHTLFFKGPFPRDVVSSLVYQESSGKRTGFIGVLPRRMQVGDKPVLVANSFHFMVDPGSRATLAGVHLLRTFFDGPQDLSLTDGAGTLGRQVWEVLGGRTSLLYSLYWTRVLRPGQFVLSAMKNRKIPAPLIYSCAPVFKLFDMGVGRAKPFRFSPPPHLVEEKLTPRVMLSNLSDLMASYSLRPEYDAWTLEWLLERASQRERFGKLQCVALREASGKLIGWYLYYLKPGATSEIVQVLAKKDTIQLVLDHLFSHACSRGSATISGRLDPRYAQDLSEKQCVFHRRGSWMLVHSKNPEIMDAIYRGDACLSRLEGEWCALYDGE